MKARLALLIAAMFVAANSYCQVSGNSVTNLILNTYSERAFTSVPVTDEQLDIVLKCGIKAPSALNRQPWKFTVVRDQASMQDAMRSALPGNVLIIVSGEDSKSGPNLFDCGLAMQNMFIAAHGLGLGARIYGDPVSHINSKKTFFQIPDGYRAVMVLRIGNVDKNTDAVSSASSRKNPGAVINYKK